MAGGQRASAWSTPHHKGTGASPTGALAHHQQGHWRITTFLAGLRRSGIVAPLVLDGPMTGETFRTYLEQVLAPTLRAGDVVVMDNLPVPKLAGVREAILAADAGILYLPPYRPDLNPIEPMFAKLKALLRKLPHQLRLCAQIN